MKTSLHVSLLVGIIFLASCLETKKPTTTEIVVVYDITDSLFSKPSADEIISRFGLDTNTSNGAEFRLLTVSDVTYNKIESATLEPVTTGKWSSNDFTRKKEIKAFEEKIRSILASAIRDSTPKKFSSVYKPIANELNRLSTSKTENKILLVYSDLMEHEKEMSFYDKRTLNLLKTKPEEIRIYLESQLPLESLAGITIYFLYQPSNAEKDFQFHIVSQFYKNLFEEKGANVIIEANLSK